MHKILSNSTNAEAMRELGARIRAYRLQQNLGVAAVARLAGLNRNTIVNAEAGKNPRLDTLVRLLRVYGRLDALDAFLPEPPISPLELLKRRGRPRQRARARRDA